MKIITGPDQLSTEFVSACEMYLLAKAHVEQVRADIEPIRQSVIDRHNFPAAHKFSGDREHITSFTHDYLMSDANFRTYLREVIPQVAALGYKVSSDPDSYGCPISAAESLLYEVNWHMLNVCVAELEMFPVEDLLGSRVKLRDQLTDTLIKLAMPRIRTGQQIIEAMLPEKAQVYFERSARHH